MVRKDIKKNKKPNLDKLKEALESTGLKISDTKEDWKKIQWCMNRIVDLACAIIKDIPEGCRPPRSIYAVLSFLVKFIRVAINNYHFRDREPLYTRMSHKFHSWEQNQQADEEDIQTIGDVIKKFKIFKEKPDSHERNYPTKRH